MQLDLLSPRARPAPPRPPAPAPGWVEECPGRWVRHPHPHRLAVQQDAPADPWRWWVQLWPTAQLLSGTAPTAQIAAHRAERALESLR